MAVLDCLVKYSVFTKRRLSLKLHLRMNIIVLDNKISNHVASANKLCFSQNLQVISDLFFVVKLRFEQQVSYSSSVITSIV